MDKIFYVGYYDIQQNGDEERYVAASAVTKMDYVIDAITFDGKEVTVVSPSWTKKRKYVKGKTVDVKDKVKLKLFGTFYSKISILRAFNRLRIKTHLFFYLLKNAKKNCKIIVYHSTEYTGVFKILKKIKKCPIYLELEELYGDVKGNKKLAEKEIKYAKNFYGYIFPTELLDEKINNSGKPSVIIYGTYATDNKPFNKKEYRKILGFDENKIHLVYAGTFSEGKGASNAVLLAKYLPQNYCVHILGFGLKAEIEGIEKLVDETAKISKAELDYRGLLKGEEYINFLKSCDIGLATQNIDEEFNGTSFPSKILSYMSNGLKVVSVKIPAIEISRVAKNICFYEGNDPQEIANAVMGIDLKKIENQKDVVIELDKKFKEDIKTFLEN